MTNLTPYKTQHLFLLVGSNPLPNYVAIKLLAVENGQIYFIHTSDTDPIAQNLARSLGITNVRYIPVDDAEATDIFRKVAEAAKDKESIGLHYTGGTKAMSVHAYRAVQAVSSQAVFSYLNARNLTMLIEQEGIRSKKCPIGVTVKFSSIKDLLELHNRVLNPKKLPITEPFQIEFCKTLLNQVPHKDLRIWCNENIRTEKGIKDKKDLKKNPVALPLDNPAFTPVHSFWADCQTLNELADKWDKSVRDVAKFIGGEWLEHYTLWAIQQVQEEYDIQYAALDINTQGVEFQVDVVAIRGYQLFAFSCTTDDTKSLIKSKLLEIYRRARQMGGDEARVAMVCYAPQNDPRKNPLLIQHEVEEEWEEAKAKVRVFGEQHLPDLADHLQRWFTHSTE